MERRTYMKRTSICAVLALAATTVATVILGAAGPAQAVANSQSAYTVQFEEQDFTGFGEATTKFGAINRARADALDQAAQAGFFNCVEASAPVAKFLPGRQVWVASATYLCTR